MEQVHDLTGVWYDAADDAFCRLRRYDDGSVYFYTVDMEDCYHWEEEEDFTMDDLHRVEEQAVEDPVTYFEACVAQLIGDGSTPSFRFADSRVEITEVSDD